MKKIVLLIIAMFLTINGFSKDIRTLFTNMPDTIIPLLTKSDRMDCMDYIESGMKAVVTNKLGGRTEMLSFEKDYLSLKLTDVSSFDMKLFYYRDSTAVICVIRTICSDMCDSRLFFYDTEWHPINKSELIEEPVFEDYVINKFFKGDSIEALSEYASLRLKKITVDQSKNGLNFSYSSIGYISEDASEYLHLINPKPLFYKWNGKTFKRSMK